MIEIKPAHAENACLAQSCFGLSKREIHFVLNFPGLNNTQKLVWISLAALNVNNPDFARQMSLNQFARMLNMRALKLWRVIQQLEAMGLVQLFTKDLPHKGSQAFALKHFRPALINLLRRYGRRNVQKRNPQRSSIFTQCQSFFSLKRISFIPLSFLRRIFNTKF